MSRPLRRPGVGEAAADSLDHVWKYDFRGDDNIVESYISYLRRRNADQFTLTATP